MKVCSTCKVLMPLTNFYITKRDGYWARCKLCHKVWVNNYRTKNNEKIREARKRRYQLERDVVLPANRAWREANRERAALYDRKKKLKHYYGLSMSDYEKMLRDQNNLCAICKQPEVRLKPDGTAYKLAVDHDHKTGVVRGLLCRFCNSVLGFIHDDVDVAMEIVHYLKRAEVVS